MYRSVNQCAAPPSPSVPPAKQPRPGIVNPWALGGLRLLASTQDREGAFGPELPSPPFYFARPGRERPSRSSSASSRRRAGSSGPAQPSPAQHASGIGGFGPATWLQGAAARATVGPSTVPPTRSSSRCSAQSSADVEGGGVTRPSHLAPTATQRGQVFSVLRLRPASMLKFLPSSPWQF